MVDLEFEGEKGAGGRLCDSGRRWMTHVVLEVCRNS